MGHWRRGEGEEKEEEEEAEAHLQAMEKLELGEINYCTQNPVASNW